MKMKSALFLSLLIMLNFSAFSQDDFREAQKILESDGGTYYHFGSNVYVSGDFALIGNHPFEKVNGTWTETAKLPISGSTAVSGDTMIIGGSGDDDNGSDAGAAYIYEKVNGVWTQTEKLLANDGATGDYFGSSVSISGDTVVIAASGDDSAYIFEKLDEIWTQTAKIFASDVSDNFGSLVSVSGNTAIIGSSWSVYVFEKIDETWTQTATLTESADAFGSSISISGEIIIVGAPTGGYFPVKEDSYRGSAYVYKKFDGIWMKTAILTASDGETNDFFGQSVSISGNIGVIGAANATYVFDLSSLPTPSPEPTPTTPTPLPTTENVLVNSDFSFGNSTGWLGPITIGTDQDCIYDFNYSSDVPSAGSAPCLRLTSPISSTTDSVIYQTLDLFGGETYYFDAAIKEPSIPSSSSFWVEFYISSVEPVDGCTDIVANSNNISLGFIKWETWVSHYVNNYDGLLSGQYDPSPFQGLVPQPFIPISYGTYYFIIKSGCLSSGNLDILLDNISFERNIPIPSPTPMEKITDQEPYVYIRNETQKLTPCDLSEEDEFGCSVSISGETIFIGAIHDDDLAKDAGAVYVFDRSSSPRPTPTSSPNPSPIPRKITYESEKIFADDGEGYDHFGHSVSISGNNAIVGAYGEGDGYDICIGAVYFFEKIGEEWIQTQKLRASETGSWDYFGRSVSISGDIAIAGDLGHEAAFIFEKQNGTWTQKTKLVSNDNESGDEFGYSVSISGTTVIIGTRWDDDMGSRSGSAYIFDKINGTWTQTAKLLANDGATSHQFGFSVSISGDKAVIGDNLGSAYIFEKINGTWQQTKKVFLSGSYELIDDFGEAVSISGDTVIVGSKEQYTPDVGYFTKFQTSSIKDVDKEDWSGSAYIYEKINGDWIQTDKLSAGDGETDDYFGSDVSIYGDIAIIGANGDDDNGQETGSAYVFMKINGSWKEVTKLLPSDISVPIYIRSKEFGHSVFVFGNTVMVGSFNDDGNEYSSGTAYIFDINTNLGINNWMLY